MLPIFPNFKILEISDNTDIYDLINSFSPYSDFDFGSMWSWDFSEKMMVSQLNKNLVVKFSDYITGDYFYSFIGSNKLNDTAEILLSDAKNTNLMPCLKLLPEVVANNLDVNKFHIETDEDNFDYILDTNLLSTLEGPDLSSKRRAVNIFIRENGNVPVDIIDVTDPKIKKDIFKLFDEWIINKEEIGQGGNEHELVAIKRCLVHSTELNLFSCGMNINNELKAFWIIGLRENNCSISHFEKADTRNFNGIFPYFKREVAKLLITETNTRYINLEQDLGIPGLRQSKQAYKPTYTLNKFIATLK